MVNIEDIYKKLNKLFPNKTIKKEHDGWTSWAFSVGDKIIRIPKGNIQDYEWECRTLNLLKNKITAEIPQTKVIDGDIPLIIHRKIIGKDWSLQSYNSLSQQAKHLFCEDIARFFSEVHNAISKDNESEFDYLKDRKPHYKTEVVLEKMQNILTDIELQEIEKISKEIEFLDNDRVLVHRDFYCDNSVVDENHRLKGVFDFLNAGIYNRHFDFLPLYCPDRIEMLTSVIELYEKMNSKKIHLEILKKLKLFGEANALVYLEINPSIKKDKIKAFNRILKYLKDELKSL